MDHYSSLPPRSTIHKRKEDHSNQTKQSNQKNRKKMNFTQVTLVFFLLILVISPFVFYQLNPSSSDKNNPISINTQELNVEEDGDLSQQVENTQEDQKEAMSIEKNDDSVKISDQSYSENNVNSDTDNTRLEIQEHIVAKGENLYRITLKYYSSGEYMNALATYNGLNDPNDIYAGLTLKIPSQAQLIQLLAQ